MKHIKLHFNLVKNISLLICISLVLAFTLELFAKKDTGFIEWRSIPAANGYRVEIKSENKIILETNVAENIYYVDLPKGKYEFRIGVLNVFKKPVVWSYWNPLRVLISKEPTLSAERLNIAQGDESRVAGNNFLENTKVSLLSQGKTFSIENKIISHNELRFATKTLKPGTYDILLENPNNKRLLKKDYLVLYDPTKGTPPGVNTNKPQGKTIKSQGIEISSDSMERADIMVDESVAGKTTVNIGPKTKDKLDISLQNKSTMDVTVDINNRSEGKVNFNVDNKSKNNLALNVKNLSKEKFSVGILDKSKGKVNVNVPDDSKNKVDIKTISTDITNFDVTIENQAKEKFDINIGEPGKALIPPIKRKPAKEIIRNDVSISSDSLEKVEIGVDESNPRKLSLNIEPLTKEDVDISLENRSKDDVTIDINNRSEGKVNLNVENKSTEKLALNINNSSNEKMNLGILEKSKGKVDVQVKETSKSKVDINKVNTNIENFDVTIDNKTKEKFDINIGKKEVKPWEPSQEKFPKDYPKYSLKEYENFVNGLQRTCPSNLDIPDILIDKCHPRHASLNLTDIDRKVLYNYLKLGSGNYISRIAAFKFFIENCSPTLKFIIELAELRLKNIIQDENEKFYTKKTIESFNTCKNKDER